MKPRRELVEAGAGCGKTYSIISRYIEALGIDPETGENLKSEEKFFPHEIIALTFTEAAALQMKERLQERLQSIGRPELFQECHDNGVISTFHSLCYKLIREKLSTKGYRSQNIISDKITQRQRQSFFLEKISQHPKSAKILKWCQLKDILELCQNYFFQDTQALKKEWAHDLFSFKTSFEKNIEHIKKDLQDTLTPEIFEKNHGSWPVILNEILETKQYQQCADLNFRKYPPKFNKNYPEIYESAQMLRDMARKKIFAGLDKVATEEEVSAYHEILDYLSDLKKGAPKLLDFKALEFELLELIQNGEELLPQKAKLVIVDEFQDTNFDQFKIIQNLSDARTHWYFVGDPKQSIYSFRGADIKLYQKLRTEIALVPLSTNWRSSAQLLNLLNALQEEIFSLGGEFDPSPQTLQPAPKNEKLPNEANSIWHLDVPKEKTLSHCALRLQKKLSSSSEETHGVLFQNWKKLNEFAEILNQKKIPYQVIGQESFFDHPLSHIFCSFLSSAFNEQNLLYSFNQKRWKSSSHKHETKLPKELNWSEMLLQFSCEFQTFRWKRGREWASCMAAQIKAWEDQELPLKYNLLDFIQLIEEHRYDGVERPPLLDSQQACVSLMTIHGSKGLEFDHVYLPDLYSKKKTNLRFNDGDEEEINLGVKFWNKAQGQSRPSLLNLYQKRCSEEKKESELKRLLYVALTRAGKVLEVFFQHRKTLRKSSADYGALLGWPLQENFFWDSLLIKATEGKSHLALEKIAFEIPEDETEHPDQSASSGHWLLPAKHQSKSSKQSFFLGGVSSFLEKLGQETVTPSLSKFKKKNSSEEFGNQLHQCLQTWNGSIDHLNNIIDPNYENAEKIHAALKSLKKIEELQDYWTLLSNDPSKVLREADLILHDPSYELTGTADVLYACQNKLFLIDWKTSSSPTAFQNTGRINKIKQQLSLYAKGFEKQFREIHLISVGFFPHNNSYTAELILNEPYRQQ